MLVDSHLHLLPVRLNQAIRAFFATQGIEERTFAYPLDPGEVCELLAAEGVTDGWTLPYARRPGTAEALNASVAAIVAAQAGGPVRLVGGCTVHPGDDDPVAIVRRGVENDGARVLKLHCSVGEYTPDDRRLDGVWAYASEVALPVVVHAGHAPSGHTSADELDPIGTVASRFPEAPIVIAHCGHHAVDAALDLLEAHPWVHADLTPVIHDPVALPSSRARDLWPKLLFGSDAPNTARTVRDSRNALDALDLPTHAVAAIAGGNARRLIAEIRT